MPEAWNIFQDGIARGINPLAVARGMPHSMISFECQNLAPGRGFHLQLVLGNKRLTQIK